jgi:hypothetical protein
MNVDLQAKAEQELAESKTAARLPDFSDPYWNNQIIPWLIYKQVKLLDAIRTAKPEEVAYLQGRLQMLHTLMDAPNEQAAVEKMLQSVIDKWKPKQESTTDGRGTTGTGTGSAGWLSTAGRRLTKR